MTVTCPAITLQLRDHDKVMEPYTFRVKAADQTRAASMPGTARPVHGHQNSPAGRLYPPAEVTGMRVLRQDRLGSLIREYAQVA